MTSPSELFYEWLEKVIAVLQKGGVWSAIEQRAEIFLTATRAAKVVSLLPPVTGSDKDAEFLLVQTTPAILREHQLLGQALNTGHRCPHHQPE